MVLSKFLMGNSFKNTWWIFLLIAAGGIIFFLSLHPSRPQADQGVVLNDIFPQKSNPLPAVPPASPVSSVPPMAVVTSSVGGHNTGFTIQVYSFQDKNRAENALQSLKKRGYQAFLIVSNVGENRVWYRVRIGAIGDEAAARKMLDDIRKNYNSGIIIKPSVTK